MGENEHQSREWSIDIDQENNLEEVLEPALDCCIYRVPLYLRKINEEAYTPKLISIGPLHCGRKELMGMENQKKRYWSKFGERVNAQKLEEFKTYMESQEQSIRGNYSVTSKLRNSKYVAMILYDAVFIIELFLRNFYRTNDFLLKSPMANSIIEDLLLLENQVPYFVLNDLYMKAFPSSEGDPSFFDLSLSFFSGMSIFNNVSFSAGEPQVNHFTDFLRGALIMEVQSTVQSNGRKIYDLPTATKLNESGLKFKGLEGKCLLDISLEKRKRGKWLPWFEVNELQIPRIQIYDDTESMFRNLMALEMFHYPTQTHICNYVFLLDYLIDTSKDVDLLVEKEIIVNYMGDNEAIAKLFNTLCQHIILSNSCYYDISEQIKAHYKYPWNHLKATFKSVYFSNLWTGTATVAATFLLILTVIQTVCSIKQIF
ncbi:hypothetical protein Ddye_018208 [Dipteronia dyeriana]|uniref:Uncharacterized protein n=1 Tax=Dipteronia dyeriana TaxID=168575 RepID=A0AAD9UAY8_9ROSI|nr:hypothetical protein Ddye_018208 [Dipteronia dyeriana]